MIDEKRIKQEYDLWIELLEKTGNKDLLKDPYNVWLEAWHVSQIKKDPVAAGS